VEYHLTPSTAPPLSLKPDQAGFLLPFRRTGTQGIVAAGAIIITVQLWRLGQKMKVVYLSEFDNKESARLYASAQGVIRVYKKDRPARTIRRRDSIDHTPKNERCD